MRERISSVLHGTAVFLVVVSVMMSAWLFGCVEPWMSYIIYMLIFIALSLSCLSILLCAPRALHPKSLFVVMLLFLAYIALQQSTFLPSQRPEASEAFSEFQALLDKEPAAGTMLDLEQSSPHGLSLAPRATRESLVAGLGCFSVIVIVLLARPNKNVLSAVCALVFLSILAMAIYGVYLKSEDSRLLLGLYRPRYSGNIFAAFTNRNHFASLANMGLGLGLAVMAPYVLGTYKRYVQERHEGDSSMQTIHSAILWTGPACVFLACGFMVVSMVMTFSRGGIISLVLSWWCVWRSDAWWFLSVRGVSTDSPTGRFWHPFRSGGLLARPPGGQGVTGRASS